MHVQVCTTKIWCPVRLRVQWSLWVHRNHRLTARWPGWAKAFCIAPSLRMEASQVEQISAANMTSSHQSKKPHRHPSGELGCGWCYFGNLYGNIMNLFICFDLSPSLTLNTPVSPLKRSSQDSLWWSTHRLWGSKADGCQFLFLHLLNHSHPLRQFHIWPVAWPHCPWQIAGLSLWHSKGAAMPGLRPVLSWFWWQHRAAGWQKGNSHHLDTPGDTMLARVGKEMPYRNKLSVCSLSLGKSRNRHQSILEKLSLLCYVLHNTSVYLYIYIYTYH